MQNNEFNNNTIYNSEIHNHQTNIINDQSKFKAGDCIEQKSKSIGKYFTYLIVNTIAFIADISTIVGFFISSNQETPVSKCFDVFQNHKSMIYLIAVLALCSAIFVILTLLRTRKGYGRFVFINNEIRYIITKKCPHCNHNAARKLSVKSNGLHQFQFVCKNNPNHNIDIDYGCIIDYIQ